MKVYSYDEALEDSKAYFGGEELPAKVFVDKYALRNAENELVESNPNQTHRRIAKEIARIEASKFKTPYTEDFIFEQLANFTKIIPQGSPIFGIGNPYQCVSIANCFVTPSPHNSYGGIMTTDQHIAQISKRRGGWGGDISTLCPANTRVRNASKTSTGAVSFMPRYSNTLREVAQNGRRGAGMLTISVHHPDILAFATIKNDDVSVTGANISIRLSDEFLEAVQQDKDYELRWPVDSDTPTISRMISAREVWKTIIHSAWLRAEPGLLFWDRILEGPADCYSKHGFKTVSTNPCITGDTLVYVADGRGNVPIKVLAEQGKDVDVFCLDNDGQITIRKMRNPRVTGYSEQVYKVTLDDGSVIRCTGNHKLLKKDGEYCEVKNLLPGDSLRIITRFEASIKETIEKAKSTSVQNYLWIDYGNNISKTEHRLIAAHNYGEILNGYIVHHKDFNSQNNSPDNLEIMTKKAHDRLHGDLMMGDNNPMRRAKYEWSKEKWQQYHDNMSAAVSGEDNSRYCGISNEELFEWAKTLTIQLGRRFSKKEWQNFAKINGLPLHFSKFRKDYFGSIQNMSKMACEILNMKNYDYDPRILRNQIKMEKMGYETEIINNTLCVKRVCEFCKKDFFVNFDRREAGFCSPKCNATYQSRKRAELKSRINHKIVSVELDGYEDIYNGTVDEYHNFMIGAFEGLTDRDKNKWQYVVNLNCGEIPLSEFDSCRLLAINLFHAINNPFRDNAEFDYEKLYETAYIAQRLMDDFVDLELECIDRIITKVKNDPEPDEIKETELSLWQNIKEVCAKGRRTGTGVTGLGDTLAALGIKYGSEESIAVTEKIYKTLKLGAYRASVDMAKELGAFPVWDHNLEKDNDFLLRIKDEDSKLWNDMKRYGRRNIACLTTAPTGTISILAMLDIPELGKRFPNITSGIEPAYAVSFTRRKKGNPGDKDFRVDFVDKLGDSWMEFEIYHSGLAAWMAVTGKDNIAKSPYNNACAANINWKNRVKLQAAAQRHIDHSISSTINLPEDVSEEEVAIIYETAWEAGCKGVTVYRDKCRSGVLITKEEKTTENTERPKELECEVHHVTVKGQLYFVLVGMMNGKPYEVFAGKNEHAISRDVKSGIIVKKERPKSYKLVCDDETELVPLTAFCNDEQAMATRLISTSLRYGADIDVLVSQLEKIPGEMTNFAKSIARCLKKYIPDGTKVDAKCDSCNEEAVVRENGCKICKNCGASTCS